MFEIEFYENRRGESPVHNYLIAIDQKAEGNKRAQSLLKKIYYAMELLQESGVLTGMPHVKHIDGKLYELRVSKERVFFFQKSGGTITMLSHFTKKTRKTPKKELDRAIRYMKDWESR
jgi:phage-related protein